jgi:hypothetical protein
MADKQRCEAALHSLAARLEEHARTAGPPKTPDRTMTCRIPDLRTSYSGMLRGGYLIDIAEGERSDSKIIFTVNSDDLVAVTEGSMSFLSAWTSRRLKINASMRDLLRIRSLL